MKSFFTADFFRDNRQRLRDATEAELIVVAANGLLQRAGDSTYPFKQDANFWYLTGIDEPDIVLVIDKSREYLIVPGRDASREAFDGSVEADLLTLRSGIATIHDETSGWKLLEERLKRVAELATVVAPPAYIERYGIYTNPARSALVEKCKAVKASLEITDLSQDLVRMRMVKQQPELLALKRAIAITNETLQAVANDKQLKTYEHEYELEAAITQGFRSRGASGHSFEPIVASGKHGCTLHNISNNGPLAPDELVVLDVGAEFEGYTADITRTVAYGMPTDRQRAVHAAVLAAQEHALSLLKPGVELKAYEDAVAEFVGEQLQDLGLIEERTPENIRHYFPHATSHFLGLYVHDSGDYSQPLQAGVVMTVEPGIYIPEEGIGVRIEDDVLITENGVEVLSAALPRELGSLTME